jgi:uncharacterized membrane protein
MTDHNSEPASTPKQQSFKAVLTPNRSLGPTGFLILMSAVGLVSFVVGLAFASMGAWPVMGFFGLDVALIYWAFRQNYRSGRASEVIEVTPHSVLLTRYDEKGRATELDFNTYWVRLALEERSDGRSHLNLVTRGDKTLIADFLSDEERRDFAEVLARELAMARTRTSF